MAFNPMDYPLMFRRPERLSDVSAWVEHIPFAYALIQMCRPRMLVELGTQKGDSYCAFCEAISALQLPTRCTAIDKWTGDEQTGFFGNEVLTELRAYHDP